ncbi:MAG TPA: pyrroline-5-carboxylate reductase, partial [Alphaproteobacteria bacterium]|nr:pyrroline-5-carboxylate reductase [Alphaproteobacteria bacterium]
MIPASRILLVGCGKMGGALLDGWRERFSDLHILVADPVSPEADVKNVGDAVGPFDCVVLAVKPQVMAETLAEIAPLLTPHMLVLSIAAGKTIAFYESHIGESQPIVRVMPNTPAAIGCGMSVLCANAHVSAVQKQLATSLMSAVGFAEWIDDESLMDAVTAVSGSGPAYVFHMIEALAAA